MSASVLFAALNADDLIKIVLVILFIVVPAVLKLLGKGDQPQKPAAGRRPPARPAADGVEDEIGDFLRQAAKRRGGRPQRRVEKPIMAEAIHEIPAGQQVQQHVGEYLDAGEFSRRAAQLGDEVAQADEKIEDRLHQVFDHKVSDLAAVPGERAASPLAVRADEQVVELPATAAAGLPALFSNAQSIRQAIVINEILQRPEHRWT